MPSAAAAAVKSETSVVVCLDDSPPSELQHGRHSMFLEIVRDDRDQSLTLNFRRKGRPVDGQAFYCLCRADVAADPNCLFQRLASSTSALKRFAVQSDMFHHTGVLECGYCTVTASVGTTKLHRIHPNVPYLVALAIHGEAWTKRALGGGGGGGAVEVPPKVSTTVSPATVAIVAASTPPMSAVTSPTSTASQQAAQQPLPVMTLGDDAMPFVERVVLRELRDQGSRIRPAFHVFGRSPWQDNLIPSLDCVRYLSIMTHNFFKKNSIHLQSVFANSSASPAGSVSPGGGGGNGGGKKSRGTGGKNPIAAAARRPLLQRQLTIHGVADPLCGAVVSFLLSASDAVQQFRKRPPPALPHVHSTFTPGASRTSMPPNGSGGGTARQHNYHHTYAQDAVVSGSPHGALPTAGDLLDAISALGSRAQSSASLSSSWVIDWFDILLLCTLDAPSLKRVAQVASQFKLYDIEGQPIQARLLWMLRPEKRAPPRGSLAKLFVDEAMRLDLERMHPTTRGSGSYVPCVLSPGRAIWTWMPHRQQVRALYYAVALPPLCEAVESASKQLHNPALVQPLYRKNRREHARRRLSVWIQFIVSLRKRRASMMERQYSQSTSAPLLLSLAERAEASLLQVYMTKWLRHRIIVRFMAPMDKQSEMTHLRYRFRVWRIASTRQYNIRVPRHLTIAVRGEEGLLPMPKMWVRCMGGGRSASSGQVQQWSVLHDVGDGRGVSCTTVTKMSSSGGAWAEKRGVQRQAHRLLPTQNRVPSQQQQRQQRRRPRDFCGASVQLFYILQRITDQRQMFDVYRVWHAFAAIAKHYRQQQIQQIKAVQALAAHLQPSANLMSRRVWFIGWKMWAQQRQHQRNITHNSAESLDDDVDDDGGDQTEHSRESRGPL